MAKIMVGSFKLLLPCCSYFFSSFPFPAFSFLFFLVLVFSMISFILLFSPLLSFSSPMLGLDSEAVGKEDDGHANQRQLDRNRGR